MSAQSKILRSAESVSPKHPDKICDQISDAILDALLEQDEHSRVAVETIGGHGLVLVTGEVTSHAKIDYEAVIRQFIHDHVDVKINLVQQSPEIAAGVDNGGAGDQGVMIGYATAETPELIPLEAALARSLNKFIYAQFPHDGKTQITLANGEIVAVVASFQHAKTVELQGLVHVWLKDKKSDKSLIHANPGGDWEIGGFDSDAGLTGRKLVVDNYGPRIPVGGGCFSGKDPSKVDRSAAYMARKVAVDYLTKRHAQEVYCYLAYAIGVAEPVQATIIIDGVEESVEGYDLSPNGLIAFLNLKQTKYTPTAQWGHFGNGFAWDKP